MEDIETDGSHGAMLQEGAHEACGLDTAAPAVGQGIQENAADSPHGTGALGGVEENHEAEAARREHGCRANTHHNGRKNVDGWSDRRWLQGTRGQASALDMRQSGGDRRLSAACSAAFWKETKKKTRYEHLIRSRI